MATEDNIASTYNYVYVKQIWLSVAKYDKYPVAFAKRKHNGLSTIGNCKEIKSSMVEVMLFKWAVVSTI